MDATYWRRQTSSKLLFPNIEWNKPERRDQAGRLTIIGGNKLGFAAAAESYQTALDAGVGHVRVVLPDCLKRSLPTITDAVFAPCTPSGGLAKDAMPELLAAAEWSNGVLLIGDAGRNSETAILYEQFVKRYEGPLTVSRDAIDLLKNDVRLLVERPNTVIVASFAQVQKIFQAVYYPKVLTFNMQLLQLVEALHKFTVTYPCHLMTLHKDTLIIATGGEIITQQWQNPMAIWRGSVATFGELPKDAKKLEVSQSVGRVETFVTNGAPNDTALKPTNRGIELVAVGHPNDLFAGEEATFRVLVDGKPAAGLEFEIVRGATRYRNAQDEITAQTGRDGKFQLTWPHAGMYWINAAMQDGNSGSKLASKRRLSYTATLEVLPE